MGVLELLLVVVATIAGGAVLLAVRAARMRGHGTTPTCSPC